MKTLYLFSILNILCTITLTAQSLFIDTYIENTQISPKNGIALGYEFKNRFEVGVFHQKESTLFDNSQETVRPRFYEKEFSGLTLSGPIISRQKLDLKLNARTGVSNKTNFAITPSMILGLRPIKQISINAGIGIRSFNPTYRIGVRFNL